MVLALATLGARPRKSSPAAVAALVRSLGYVQIDSINVLDRAHHLILSTRLREYAPRHLAHNLERARTLFEHWTHDASAIPIEWYAHWGHRFSRHEMTASRRAWWNERFGGKPDAILERTLARVRDEGPLRARDFEPPDTHRASGWWSWHPEKAALEHLWRVGALAIARRDGFEKVYDLAERVHPERAAADRSDPASHLDWACREAMARLGVATPKEISAFFHAISIADARTWAEAAVRRGELVDVRVQPERGGAPIRAVAIPEWRRFAREIDEASVLALCPFDPVVRDRARLERLFGFTYRFEAFVPAAKREYGYYVLPILRGDRFVGRVDPKFDRERGVLAIRGPWWEPDVARESAGARKRLLAAALDTLASNVGAASWELVKP